MEAVDAAVRMEAGVRVRVPRWWLEIGCILALAFSLSACGASGITHVVRPGENLYRIGKAYGVPYGQLAKINAIAPPYRLEVGDRIHIPGASKQLPVSLITPSAVSAAPPREANGRVARPLVRPERQSSRAAFAKSTPAPNGVVRPDGRIGVAGFSWPVNGRLSSPFGRRARGHHDGIDIVAPKGSLVFAARDGTVIFADKLSGYGNVLIVEHAGGFTTVYAHNEANLVSKGTRVRRGQAIARVGDTGRATGSHLHFEVRKQNVARNPLYYLPGGSTASVAAAQ